MPTLFRNEYAIERLTQQEHLPEILEHKWYVSERLGRDIGFRVAAVDYFENIRPRRAERDRGTWLTRLFAWIAPAADDSPASLLNFERVMQGTRTLAR